MLAKRGGRKDEEKNEASGWTGEFELVPRTPHRHAANGGRAAVNIAAVARTTLRQR